MSEAASSGKWLLLFEIEARMDGQMNANDWLAAIQSGVRDFYDDVEIEALSDKTIAFARRERLVIVHAFDPRRATLVVSASDRGNRDIKTRVTQLQSQAIEIRASSIDSTITRITSALT